MVRRGVVSSYLVERVTSAAGQPIRAMSIRTTSFATIRRAAEELSSYGDGATHVTDGWPIMRRQMRVNSLLSCRYSRLPLRIRRLYPPSGRSAVMRYYQQSHQGQIVSHWKRYDKSISVTSATG